MVVGYRGRTGRAAAGGQQKRAYHPQTLGYWAFGEPENALYRAYAAWDQKKDQGLAEWIAEGMKWTYETLKSGDPDAYVMPTIAWWTTYEVLAPLYDVNAPNEYPTLTKDLHFSPAQELLWTEGAAGAIWGNGWAFCVRGSS